MGFNRQACFVAVLLRMVAICLFCFVINGIIKYLYIYVLLIVMINDFTEYRTYFSNNKIPIGLKR